MWHSLQCLLKMWQRLYFNRGTTRNNTLKHNATANAIFSAPEVTVVVSINWAKFVISTTNGATCMSGSRNVVVANCKENLVALDVAAEKMTILQCPPESVVCTIIKIGPCHAHSDSNCQRYC